MKLSDKPSANNSSTRSGGKESSSAALSGVTPVAEASKKLGVMSAIKVKIYADGADLEEMKRAYASGLVSGFTTNPTLMKKAGIKDYAGFATAVCDQIKDLPISFEVFSDDFTEMKRQALRIAQFGPLANVKIPITNTKGESSVPLIKDLLGLGLKLNVTAIFTDEQLLALRNVLRPQDDVIVSIFAGRIADTGTDPLPTMAKAVKDFSHLTGAKILWASPREVLNVFQADELGVHIITVTSDILNKLAFYKKDLSEFSLDTVKMFYNDALLSGFELNSNLGDRPWNEIPEPPQ